MLKENETCNNNECSMNSNAISAAKRITTRTRKLIGYDVILIFCGTQSWQLVAPANAAIITAPSLGIWRSPKKHTPSTLPI